MMAAKKPKSTEIQKRIRILLIENDLMFSDIAEWKGVTPQAIYQRLLRQDEKYFKEAVAQIQENRKNLIR